MLVQLIYVSTPKLGNREVINAELPKFQERNKLAGLGGMIWSHEHFILQLLEGERDKVNAIYRRIACDKRHENITLVRYNDVRQAEFTEWNFAVIDADPNYAHHDCTDCTDFLATLIPDPTVVASTITSSAAMSIIRKAAAVTIVTKAPNRRTTDIAEVFTYTPKLQAL
jgi:hypothetical protein